MKNRLKIKLINDTGEDDEFIQHLKEAFADMSPADPALVHLPASGSNSGLANGLGTPNMHRSQSYSHFGQMNRKRPGMPTVTAPAPQPQQRDGKKVQTIQQQLQGFRDVKLRNEIIARLEIDALPCNRLQHDYNEAQVNALMVSVVFDSAGCASIRLRYRHFGYSIINSHLACCRTRERM